MGTITEAEVHWFEAHGVGKRRMKSSVSRTERMQTEKHFVVCIRNEKYEASLELRKIYEVVEDPSAAKHQMLRVVDEEGEDYLYPASWFLPIELPRNLEQVILELVEH